MSAPGWLTRERGDVPSEDDWLSERERLVLAGLRVQQRRCAWRLGRFTAKAAVAAMLGGQPSEIEIIAGPDGAPEVWIGGAPAAVRVSLSHRSGRALASVWGGGEIGCDLELIEPRSNAFVSEWLAAPERALVAATAAAERAQLVNLLWAAKEAASKVRREGLRLAFADAIADVGKTWDGARTWQSLSVSWPGTDPIAGWWRHEPGWLIAVAGEPAPGLPEPLSLRM